jgi:hypothetical protein
MSPFRLTEFTAKAQFTTSAEMPRLVYLACLATGIPSNTAYYQTAVCERLSKDLGLPLDRLIGNLPPRRGPAGHLYDPDQHTMDRTGIAVSINSSGGVFKIGPANTNEEVT